MAKRETAVINGTFYGVEEDVLTCLVSIQTNSGVMLVGGIALDEDTGPDFVKCLLEAFDIEPPPPEERPGESLLALHGKECVALKCFDRARSRVEGLEAPSGKRFILQEWRQKHYPGIKTVLEEERDRLEKSLDAYNRIVRQTKLLLETLDTDYTEWTTYQKPKLIL